jgi:hypothetical protein
MHREAVSATYELRAEKASLERMLTAVESRPAPTPVPPAQRAAVDTSIAKTIATEGLRAKAEALGIDPDKALAEIDNRDGSATFNKLKGAA